MSERLIIRGGRLIDAASGRDEVGDLLIDNGRVAEMGGSINVEGAREIDAHGLVVAPGFVDVHTHLRDPGLEYKEDIRSGTEAAARGGFTTICAMPNTEPAMDTRSVVEYVLREAASHGAVRVLPIGAVTKGRHGKELAELGDLADVGCVAFSDDGAPVWDSTIMRRALEYASRFELPIIDHCEDPSLSKDGVMNEGWVSTRLGLRGVPAAAEEAAVARDIALAEATGAHLHVAHVSTRGAVAAIRAAKARGIRVTCEVTPHHLTLSDEAVAFGALAAEVLQYDTNAKVNPPLRSREDIDACVEGLADGTIDCIATDHAPHAVVEKLCEFDDAPSGISGLETAFALCMTLAQRKNGRLTLADIVERMSIAPVRALGLDRHVPGIGTLAIGTPADIVVLDPAKEWIVAPERFASKGKNTPLSGVALKGAVVATIASGRLVHDQLGVPVG